MRIDAAHPRLDVLFGLVGLAAREDGREHPAQRVHRRLDPHHLVADAEQARALRRVVERGLRRVAGRHGDAEDPLRTQRIDGDGRCERRIDPAGEPDQHAGEAVLVDIVGEPQCHGAIGGGVTLRQRGARAGLAGPAVALPRPAGERERLLEGRRLGGESVVRVEDEGGSVEDELVLPAHLVHVDQRQVRLADAGNGEVEAGVALVALEG